MGMKRVWTQRRLVIGTAVIALVLAAGLLYDRSYPVAADDSNLEEEVLLFLERGRSLPLEYEVELFDACVIGKQKFVLMELHDGRNSDPLGYVRLERGLNGRYQIAGTRYGTGNYWETIVRQDEEAVLLIGGRNAWFGIETIRVDVEREAYVVTVPEGDRYLVAVPVAAPEGQTHVLPEDIRFYDAHGADLTEQIWNR